VFEGPEREAYRYYNFRIFRSIFIALRTYSYGVWDVNEDA
jgi:hypothetical protein